MKRLGVHVSQEHDSKLKIPCTLGFAYAYKACIITHTVVTHNITATVYPTVHTTLPSTLITIVLQYLSYSRDMILPGTCTTIHRYIEEILCHFDSVTMTTTDRNLSAYHNGPMLGCAIFLLFIPYGVAFSPTVNRCRTITSSVICAVPSAREIFSRLLDSSRYNQ
jgi:hypothetical protein